MFELSHKVSSRGGLEGPAGTANAAPLKRYGVAAPLLDRAGVRAQL